MSYPTLFTTPGVRTFAEEIDAERQRQLAKWGEQHHPDGTDLPGDQARAENAREVCQAMARRGKTTWRGILAEEVAEAEAERDPARLRAELVQVAAVCAAWIADLDSRQAAAPLAVLPATTNHDTAPAATCSAQYHGPGEDRARLCIRAAQHQRTAHTDEHGFHWSDTVAMYPVADGTFRIGTDVRAELRRVADETAAPSDVGAEFVQQVDQPDAAGLAAWERNLADETAATETEAEPTAEEIARDHVTTLHLIGEQLTTIEGWFWEHLADVRTAEQPAVGARQDGAQA